MRVWPIYRIPKWQLKALLWATGVAAALFVTGWVVWSNAERIPKYYLEAAEQKWRAADYLGAVREYEKIAEDHPRSRLVPEATFWVGVLYYLYLDDLPKSVDAFQKSIRLSASAPGNLHAISSHRYLAEIYEKKYDKAREAISELEKVMELASDSDLVLESQYKIGELYVSLGDADQARTEWDLLIKRDPKSKWAPAALYRQGSTYFVQGKCKEAIGYYQKLTTGYPESEMIPFAQFRTANCLEEEGEKKGALDLYRALIGRYPNKELVEAKVAQLEKGMPKEEMPKETPETPVAAPFTVPSEPINPSSPVLPQSPSE